MRLLCSIIDKVQAQVSLRLTLPTLPCQVIRTREKVNKGKMLCWPRIDYLRLKNI